MPKIIISVNVNKSPKGRDQVALDLNYLRAIRIAGGEPMVVNPLQDLAVAASQADGWMITGGADLPPQLYGQQTHEKSELISEDRIIMEQALFAAINDTAKPILGICFGCQFLNVMHGGSLVQHMQDRLGHERHTEGESVILLSEDSRLARSGLPERFDVKCSHHQMIDRAAPNWKIVAHDEQDRVPEAIEENSDRWRVGIQWHPERTLESEASMKLFAAFVKACANQR